MGQCPASLISLSAALYLSAHVSLRSLGSGPCVLAAGGVDSAIGACGERLVVSSEPPPPPPFNSSSASYDLRNINGDPVVGFAGRVRVHRLDPVAQVENFDGEKRMIGARDCNKIVMLGYKCFRRWRPK